MLWDKIERDECCVMRLGVGEEDCDLAVPGKLSNFCPSLKV